MIVVMISCWICSICWLSLFFVVFVCCCNSSGVSRLLVVIVDSVIVLIIIIVVVVENLLMNVSSVNRLLLWLSGIFNMYRLGVVLVGSIVMLVSVSGSISSEIKVRYVMKG